jgi:hypothetical protein
VIYDVLRDALTAMCQCRDGVGVLITILARRPLSQITVTNKRADDHSDGNIFLNPYRLLYAVDAKGRPRLFDTVSAIHTKMTVGDQLVLICRNSLSAYRFTILHEMSHFVHVLPPYSIGLDSDEAGEKCSNRPRPPYAQNRGKLE